MLTIDEVTSSVLIQCNIFLQDIIQHENQQDQFGKDRKFDLVNLVSLPTHQIQMLGHIATNRHT